MGKRLGREKKIVINLNLVFIEACRRGDTQTVAALLKHPEINVNYTNQEGYPGFFLACQAGHLEVVELLLADERVDVNYKQVGNHSPFFAACMNGHDAIVALLQKYPPVAVYNRSYDGYTPLWLACRAGHLKVISLLLKDPRISLDFDVTGCTTILEECLKPRHDIPRATVFYLLREAFYYRRAQIPCNLIRAMRTERVVSFAADVFALTVLVSDKYWPLPLESSKESRFFSIASQLPLELQMVLSLRAAGEPGVVITQAEVEKSFRKFLQNTQAAPKSPAR